MADSISLHDGHCCGVYFLASFKSCKSILNGIQARILSSAQETDPLLASRDQHVRNPRSLSVNHGESEPHIVKSDNVNKTVASEDAHLAVEHEQELGFLEALKLHPTAVGWSVFFSLGMRFDPTRKAHGVNSVDAGVIMTAFDPQLLGTSRSSQHVAPYCSDPRDHVQATSMPHPSSNTTSAIFTRGNGLSVHRGRPG